MGDYNEETSWNYGENCTNYQSTESDIDVLRKECRLAEEAKNLRFEQIHSATLNIHPGVMDYTDQNMTQVQLTGENKKKDDNSPQLLSLFHSGIGKPETMRSFGLIGLPKVTSCTSMLDDKVTVWVSSLETSVKA